MWRQNNASKNCFSYDIFPLIFWCIVEQLEIQLRRIDGAKPNNNIFLCRFLYCTVYIVKAELYDDDTIKINQNKFFSVAIHKSICYFRFCFIPVNDFLRASNTINKNLVVSYSVQPPTHVDNYPRNLFIYFYFFLFFRRLSSIVFRSWSLWWWFVSLWRGI